MFSDLAELFNLFSYILTRGGWVVLVAALAYMFKILYMDYINDRWYETVEFVFLKVTVPLENEKSPIAFEQIFNQLHSTHATRNLYETYVAGEYQMWFTWEVVSIGGHISNYVRIQKKHRDTLEAAIYSQYPNAEITEAEDYLRNLPKYDPERSEYDIFGFSLKLKKPDAYPIRTYYDYEHAAAETFIDPIDGLWEELNKVNPYEMFIIQHLFLPLDDEWKKPGYQLIKVLKGERDAIKKPGENIVVRIIDQLVSPILDAIIRPDFEMKTKRTTEDPPSMMLHLSEGEKKVIEALEKNLSKLAYSTKIHCLYIAPRQKFNPGPIYTAVIGAYKSLSATDLNSLKPDTDRWTKIRPVLFRNNSVENKVRALRLAWRKRRFYRTVKNRFYFWGRPPYVLSTEEIATILHFPRTEVTVPDIEKVPVTKVKPPPELPIAQI